MSTADSHAAVAQKFNDALGARDAAGVAELYADDIIVWRNFDRRELNKTQAVKVLDFVCTKVQNLAYEQIRIHELPNGFVQQHVLTGVAPNGEPFAAVACLVVTVSDGQIARLDEYIDGAQLAPLMG